MLPATIEPVTVTVGTQIAEMTAAVFRMSALSRIALELSGHQIDC